MALLFFTVYLKVCSQSKFVFYSGWYFQSHPPLWLFFSCWFLCSRESSPKSQIAIAVIPSLAPMQLRKCICWHNFGHLEFLPETQGGSGSFLRESLCGEKRSWGLSVLRPAVRGFRCSPVRGRQVPNQTTPNKHSFTLLVGCFVLSPKITLHVPHLTIHSCVA